MNPESGTTIASPLQSSATILMVATMICTLLGAAILWPSVRDRVLQSAQHHGSVGAGSQPAAAGETPELLPAAMRSPAGQPPVAHSSSFASPEVPTVGFATSASDAPETLEIGATQTAVVPRTVVAGTSTQDPVHPQVYVPVTVHPVTINMDSSALSAELLQMNRRIDQLLSGPAPKPVEVPAVMEAAETTVPMTQELEGIRNRLNDLDQSVKDLVNSNTTGVATRRSPQQTPVNAEVLRSAPVTYRFFTPAADSRLAQRKPGDSAETYTDAAPSTLPPTSQAVVSERPAGESDPHQRVPLLTDNPNRDTTADRIPVPRDVLPDVETVIGNPGEPTIPASTPNESLVPDPVVPNVPVLSVEVGDDAADSDTAGRIRLENTPSSAILPPVEELLVVPLPAPRSSDGFRDPGPGVMLPPVTDAEQRGSDSGERLSQPLGRVPPPALKTPEGTRPGGAIPRQSVPRTTRLPDQNRAPLPEVQVPGAHLPPVTLPRGGKPQSKPQPVPDMPFEIQIIPRAKVSSDGDPMSLLENQPPSLNRHEQHQSGTMHVHEHSTGLMGTAFGRQLGRIGERIRHPDFDTPRWMEKLPETRPVRAAAESMTLHRVSSVLRTVSRPRTLP